MKWEKKTNRTTPKRESGIPGLELSYSLNPPPGDTVLFPDDTLFGSTLYPSSVKSLSQPLLRPSFIVGKARWSLGTQLFTQPSSGWHRIQ